MAAQGQTLPDDSTWINAGIVAAIKAGKSEYVLPAGTLNIAKTIVIPNATQSFTLRGSSTGQTVIKTPNVALAEAIRVGNVTSLIGYNQLFKESGAFLRPVRTRDTKIALTGFSPTKMPTFKPGSLYVLRDHSIVAHSQNGQQQPNHGEVVRISAFDSTRGVVTIDTPAGREYTDGAQLTDVSDTACSNISIRDLAFDGTVNGGANFTSGMITFGITDKLAISNIDAKSFGTRVIFTLWTRNVDMYDINVADGANPSSPGSGYGITCSLSRFVNIRECSSVNTRHSYVATNGSMDVTYDHCTASGTGNFDTHGFDERRIVYRYCDAAGGFAAGNGAWMAGGQDFLYDHCGVTSVAGDMYVGPNVRGYLATDCDLTHVSFDSRTSSPMGIPATGFADDVHFMRCRIVGKPFLLGAYDDLNFGDVTFEQCFIESYSDPLRFIGLGSGTLHFIDSIVSTTSTNVCNTPVTTNSALNLDFVRTRMYHASGGTRAVFLDKTYAGKASFTDTSFTTVKAKTATFLVNSSSMTPEMSNCTVFNVQSLSVPNMNVGKSYSPKP